MYGLLRMPPAVLAGVVLLLLTGFVIVLPSAVAQSGSAFNRCLNEKLKANDRMKICSDVIGAGQEKGRRLGLVHLQRGILRWKEKELDSALADFNSGLQLAPDVALGYLYRADIWKKKDQLDRAIADWDQALRIEPKNMEALDERARAWRAKGNTERAIEALANLLRVDPKHKRARATRAMLLQSKGDFDRALADATALLPLFPDAKGSGCTDGKGTPHGKPKDPLDRISCMAVEISSAFVMDRGYIAPLNYVYHLVYISLLNKHIDKGGKQARAYADRGEALSVLQQYDRAIADFDQALRQDSKNDVVLFGRGGAYAQKGDHDRAIADYSKAIALKPDAERAFHERARSWLAKGELDRAIADLDRCVALAPKHVPALMERARTLVKQKAIERAAADYREVIKLTSGDEEIETGGENKEKLLKQASSELGAATGDYSRLQAYYAKQIDYYATLIEQSPDNAGYRNSRAWTFHIAGRDAEGLADAEKAVELEPNEANYLDTRGHIYERTGRIDQAITDFSKAIGLNARPISSHFGRALAYEKKGDTARAIADFRAVLALKADSDDEKVWQRTSQSKLAPLMRASSGRRVALVIGNAAYQGVPVLPNPRRDAEAVAAALKGLGFQEVRLAADLSREALIRSLRDFSRASEEADWSLVYFAGHGLEIGGVNYLVPVDARLEVDRDVPFEAVPLDHVVSAVEPARKLRLVLLDACRHNPFTGRMRRTGATRAIGLGLAQPDPRAGLLIVYAAKHGEIALDGEGGANSPFATAFLKRATKSGVEIRRLFDLVRDDVLASTAKRQQPFTYGSLPGSEEFFF